MSIPASTIRCQFCDEQLVFEDDDVVDLTGGDCCPGDDNLVNENEIHVPIIIPGDR